MADKIDLAEKVQLLDAPSVPRDGDVELDEGEMHVVPRGVEHCPRADAEAHVLLIEPLNTVNTGDAGGDKTAEPVEL